MVRNKKILWLKRIWVLKIVLNFLIWGLPLLLFPLPLLQRTGTVVPDDPIYLRLLGAVITAMGVAYWYAWKDPVRNVAVLKAGVVDNALVTLVAFYFIFFRGLMNLTLMISAVLTLFFFFTFILLMPKANPA